MVQIPNYHLTAFELFERYTVYLLKRSSFRKSLSRSILLSFAHQGPTSGSSSLKSQNHRMSSFFLLISCILFLVRFFCNLSFVCLFLFPFEDRRTFRLLVYFRTRMEKKTSTKKNNNNTYSKVWRRRKIKSCQSQTTQAVLFFRRGN